MEKEKLIEKLCNEKASKNNTIDLNSYAIGLSEMYDKLKQPQVSNNKVAVAFGEWLRKQRADIFYGSPTTEHLFEIYKKATDC